mmetsp:Transcript_11807/g.27290  ORF Transcript_11807/g.27290 Transcript_11807/m.27290 type:complete len:203 (-) Transcript_11807:331-939(-)
MEGDELQRRFGRHRFEHLLERCELASFRVHVLLVHLVRQKHEAALAAEADDGLDVLHWERVARRVTRINDHKRSHAHAVPAGRVRRLCQLLYWQRPVVLLREEVADEVRVLERQRRGVERVLRDRHKHAIVRVAQEHLEHHLDPLTCAIGEEDVFLSGRYSVALGDEIRNLLANDREALALGVCADPLRNCTQIFSRSLNHV